MHLVVDASVPEHTRATFDAMPVSPLPTVLMEAEVERGYEPAELEFLKTFVTSVPPPQRFTAVGQLLGT
jgi:hypothetical protein